MAQSHFCHILLAKSESEGEPRFKVGVEQMKNKLHHLKGTATESHCKGPGFREAICDTHTMAYHRETDKQTPITL